MVNSGVLEQSPFPEFQAEDLAAVFQPARAGAQPLLITIDGDSATGKSTAQGLLRDAGVRAVQTITTRSPRADDLFTKSISDDEFDALVLDPGFVFYTKGDGGPNASRVGFHVSGIIDECVEWGATTLVVTDINALRQVKQAVTAAGVTTWCLYVCAPTELRRERLLAAGNSAGGTDARLSRTARSHRPVRARHPIYDAVIDNTGSKTYLRDSILSAVVGAGLLAP